MNWIDGGPAVKQFYDEYGYVILPQFLPAEEFSSLRDQLANYISSTVPALPREDVFYDEINDASTLKTDASHGAPRTLFCTIAHGQPVSRMCAAVVWA